MTVAKYGISALKRSDGKPRISVTSYGYDVAEGNLTGHSFISKMGYNSDVDNVTETIWAVGGAYVFPVAAQQMEVISDSASDGNTKKVTVYYLDADYVEKSEEVTLNGTTAVPTVATNILRINALRQTAGAAFVGNVDIRNLSDTPIYSRIPSGLTRARNIVYTVPAGKTLYIADIICSVGNTTGNRYARFTLRSNYNEKTGAVGTIFYAYWESATQDNSIEHPLTFPRKFTEKSDVLIDAISDASNSDAIVTCQWSGWIE